MTRKVFEDQCVLCGSKSTYVETNFQDCRYYRCENPACGDYEISQGAMDRLQDDAVWKRDVSSKACETRKQNKFIRVIIDPHSQQLTVSLVSRDSM